jgi:hypothetical protein
MADASAYERGQIESLLQPRADSPIEGGVGLFLCPERPWYTRVYNAAVAPALKENGVNLTAVRPVFGSLSDLTSVAAWVMRAEVIVADASEPNADLMYVLGLCHGLRRCPILLVRRPLDLPFNLAALRHVEYEGTDDGLLGLRESLTRAVRVFLTAARGPT